LRGCIANIAALGICDLEMFFGNVVRGFIKRHPAG